MFDVVWKAPKPAALNCPSILLNGRGDATRFDKNNRATLPVPTPHTITFDPPTEAGAKRYLLRLIVTSFEMTFVFSIDNHLLQVVSADFVPIHSYWNTSVIVGIGQRYHAIVEADPKFNLPYNPPRMATTGFEHLVPTVSVPYLLALITTKPESFAITPFSQLIQTQLRRALIRTGTFH